jgi:DNA primase
MPGIDFNRLRTEVTMGQVLDLLQFVPVARKGSQWYGRCPLHDSASTRCRAFSVNLATGRYYCHRCHSHGNQLELWSAFTRRPMYDAAIDLCRALALDVPWVQRW